MDWWRDRPMRLIQTNLREIDIPIDPVEYARTLYEFGANVALFNLGGIVANYPTRLPFHYANPRLTKDIIPELIEQLHEKGIRLIGRFDFSKVNETIGSKHLEWLYRGLDGEPVLYNGQLQCCVNGQYQQECSLEILKEALGLYPLDGVFFNMIGYQVSDYSGFYHGICQCENCLRNFGADLPRQEEPENPLYLRYLRFCQETSRELSHQIRKTIRSVRPGCAICTYTNEGVDIIRSESNSSIHRAQPEFVYESSLNILRTVGSWPELLASNAAVHFIDFPYRHAAVSPALTARRLAQNFIHGGWMDFYVIGKLNEQKDRECLPPVEKLYHLHQKAELWLTHASPLADVSIVAVRQDSPGYNPDELRGLITLLSEEHILYDVIEETALERIDLETRFRSCRLIILPNMAYISAQFAGFLNSFVERGGRLLLTGVSGSADANGNPIGNAALQCAGIIRTELREQTRGAYFEVDEEGHRVMPDLDAVDWIPLDTSWLACTPTPEAMAWLKCIPVGMFGPPEKCYYTSIGVEPGLILNRFGFGYCVVVPWQIGVQQYRFPTHAIPLLFSSIVEKVLDLPFSIRIDAPGLVEVSAFIQPDGESILVGLVNLSGQNGRAIHDPLPVQSIRISIPSGSSVVEAESLVSGSLTCTEGTDGQKWVTLPQLDLCDMVRIGFIKAKGKLP